MGSEKNNEVMYKAHYLPILRYTSTAETWAIKSYEMKCLRNTTGVTDEDKIRNETTREQPVQE